MKKLLVALVLSALTFSACEDGQMDVQSFNFGEAAVQVCGDIDENDFFLYKVSGNEALIVSLPQSAIPDGTSDRAEIIDGSQYQVIYRLYDGPINAGKICSTVPSSSPRVVEEWVAIGGTIRIENLPAFTIVESLNAKLPDGYKHTITFDNITFDTGDGTVTYDSDDEFSFGTFLTGSNKLDIGTFRCPDDQRCQLETCGNKIFRFTGSKALTLHLSQTTYDQLFSNTEGEKTALITADDLVQYRVFDIGVSVAALCADQIPSGIRTLETWRAQAGNGTTGVLAVQSVQDIVDGPFYHKVWLRKVIFEKDNTTFTFGDSYYIGNIVTGI